MDNPLAISGIGMLVLFLALALLYGLMYALTGLTRKRPEVGAKEEGSAAALPSTAEGAAALPSTMEGAAALMSESVLRRRAAAIAVALARAERELPRATAGVAEEDTGRGRISPWRALHHQRQLARNLPPRRAR